MKSLHSNIYLDFYNFLNQFASNSNDFSKYSQLPQFPHFQFQRDLFLYAGDSFIYFPYIFFLTSLLVGIGRGLWSNSYTTLFLTTLASYNEKELSSLDDLFIILFIFFIFFFYNFIGCWAFFWGVTKSNSYLTLIIFIPSTLVLIPLTMLYNFGFSFIITVRGSSASLSLLYELIIDYVNLMSFFLRLVIQFIRVVVIGVVYLGYNHLFLTYNCWVAFIPVFEVLTSITFDNIFELLIHFGFELLHTFIIFLMQMFALCVMVFWLAQFLFSLFVIDIYEFSFLFKRKI